MAELTKRQDRAIQEHVIINHLRSDGYLHCNDCKRIKCELRDMAVVYEHQDEHDVLAERCFLFNPKRLKLADFLAYLKYGGLRRITGRDGK